MGANPDFVNSLAALSFDLVREEINDNIIDNQVFFWDIARNGMKEEKTGGLMIDELVELSENTAAQPYADGDELPLTPQDPFTRVRYDWKYYAVPVTITGPTKFRNSGDRTQIASLLEGLINNADTSLRLRLNADCYGDGSDGISIVGIQAAVENGAAWSTYGGINSGGASAAEQRWRNQWIGSVGSFSANGRAELTNLINNCTKRGRYPTLGITTQAIHTELELSMTVNEKYEMSAIKDEDMVRAGFKHLMFKGIPVTWDTDAPAGSFYVLNSTGMKVVIGKDFEDTDFQRPDNKDAQSKLTLVYIALITKARYLNGVMDGITTP